MNEATRPKISRTTNITTTPKVYQRYGLVFAGNASAEEAWLVRVLVNIRRDQWRKIGIRNRHDRMADDGFHTAQNWPNPETALIAKATKTTVWQALGV